LKIETKELKKTYRRVSYTFYVCWSRWICNRHTWSEFWWRRYLEYIVLCLWVRACGLIMVMCVSGKKEKKKGANGKMTRGEHWKKNRDGLSWGCFRIRICMNGALCTDMYNLLYLASWQICLHYYIIFSSSTIL